MINTSTPIFTTEKIMTFELSPVNLQENYDIYNILFGIYMLFTSALSIVTYIGLQNTRNHLRTMCTCLLSLNQKIEQSKYFDESITKHIDTEGKTHESNNISTESINEYIEPHYDIKKESITENDEDSTIPELSTIETALAFCSIKQLEMITTKGETGKSRLKYDMIHYAIDTIMRKMIEGKVHFDGKPEMIAFLVRCKLPVASINFIDSQYNYFMRDIFNEIIFRTE